MGIINCKEEIGQIINRGLIEIFPTGVLVVDEIIFEQEGKLVMHKFQPGKLLMQGDRVNFHFSNVRKISWDLDQGLTTFTT